MNFSALLGILFAVAVFMGGLATSSSNINIYFNTHAFLIVIGGTLASALISFPFRSLWRIKGTIFKKVMGKYGTSPQQLVSEIVELATLNRETPEALRERVQNIGFAFLRESLNLYLDGTLSIEKLEILLRKRTEILFIKQEADSHLIRSLARFPPAFGLLGAVMGMITLLQGLGSQDSFKQIGPAMAMAMISTMYGIAIANFILLPLSTNLSKINQEDFMNRSIVIDGLKLLHAGEHPIIVEETLKSYMLSSDPSEKELRAA